MADSEESAQPEPKVTENNEIGNADETTNDGNDGDGIANEDLVANEDEVVVLYDDVEMAEDMKDEEINAVAENGDGEEKENIVLETEPEKQGDAISVTEDAISITEDTMKEEEDEENEENKETHEGDGEHDEEDEEDDTFTHSNNQDPNVMPQVNVAVLAQRKWQVKVYPLKPQDFVSGRIAHVFKQARESLLYLLSPGRNARGKGEMYLSSVNQAIDTVRTLMTLEYFHSEINVEIIRKNEEGVVEEKAYLRFDSRLTSVLTARLHRKPYTAPGRKRDRLIGSVFLKNLPPGTSKDTLRVMFPFASEVNYNPEKFKECTARLVLKNRNHVIPCLKAFAKVELGGNVLELHPLSKRKISRSEEDSGPSVAKQRKRTDSEGGETEKISKERKGSSQKESVKKDDAKPSASKVSQGNKPTLNRSVMNRPATSSTSSGRTRNQERTKFYRQRIKKARAAAAAFATPNPGTRAPVNRSGERLNRPSAAADRSYRSNRDDVRRSSSQSGTTRGKGGPRRRYNSGDRMSQSSYGRMGGGLGVSASLSASDVSLAASAEATKEMVLLQNQLSMAIKNQLAMLNQTTMAVEQVKRGASSVGLGSESFQSSVVSRTSPKDIGPSASRRSVDQYRTASSLDDNRYSGYERSRPFAKRGGGNPGRTGSTGSGRGGGVGRGGRGGGGSMGRDGRSSGSFSRDGHSVHSSGNLGRGGGNVGREGHGGGNFGRGGANSGRDGGNRRQRRRQRNTGNSVEGYNARSVGGYGDAQEKWNEDASFSQYSDPYMTEVDYGYERSTGGGYGSSSRSYNQSGYSSFF